MIYVYDANTTEFLQQEDAEKPSDSAHLFTLIAPPTVSEGKTALFNGEVWKLFNDYRGRYWNKATGSEVEPMKDIPSDPPDSALTSKKIPPRGEYEEVQWNDSLDQWDVVSMMEEEKNKVDDRKINKEIISLFRRAIVEGLNWDDFKLAVKARAKELKDQRP